ncbi:MAG: hypothetical protein PSV18_12985 [Methylobacter sp.]|nr:hypothetical protein [Candidatus Methylobacter titanis]
MTGEDFEYLTDAQVQSLDQFILRFTKLQDAMDSRLFPALLQYLQEPYEERPMLDKLNRLEKLRYRVKNENHPIGHRVGWFFYGCHSGFWWTKPRCSQ